VIRLRNHIIFGALLAIGLAAVLLMGRCSSSAGSTYQNIDNPKATYVGIEKCSTCHADVYNTYIETGMGKSWGLATKQKSAANFDPAKALVYDAQKDLYYHPYWDKDSLRFLEYRLLDGDTVHKRVETIHYIVGSGQHTNSHIINTNGYLHQAPITFYTQKGQWDLAPGYENGNTRFDRKIEAECITCHNGYPSMVEGSINKYAIIKHGIDCERCHGPGSLHADVMALGNLVDTHKTPDYTIVNPRRMSIDQQNNLCMRCHLQGVSALNDGKTFFDFSPSKFLSDSWHVFLPEHEQNNKMIMASHVERMQMSKCYTKSNAMSCITCHNPHISVKSTPAKQYNNACISCHTNGKVLCSEKLVVRQAKQDNCYECHMSKNESVDIPHVAVHDHRIVKYPNTANNSASDAFVQLKCYNNANVPARAKARGYLEFYERYAENAALLDTAEKYLAMDNLQQNIDFEDLIRLNFLRKSYANIAAMAKKLNPKEMKSAWNAYRVGEALMQQSEPQVAEAFLSKAAMLMKYNLDFEQKLATCYLRQNKTEDAKRVMQFIVTENYKQAAAQSGLGYIAIQEKNFVKAKQYADMALMLEPDNVQNLINLAVIYYNTQEQQKIKPLLLRARLLDPANQQVLAMLQDIQ
jgi:Flp pilus assembly protein TadD